MALSTDCDPAGICLLLCKHHHWCQGMFKIWSAPRNSGEIIFRNRLFPSVLDAPSLRRRPCSTGIDEGLPRLLALESWRRGDRPRIEAHLRRIFKTFAAYSNEVSTRCRSAKTHRTSDVPRRLATSSRCQFLGGLHHQRWALSFDEAQRGNRQLIYLGVYPSFLRHL
jgi:hypothetical protein